MSIWNVSKALRIFTAVITGGLSEAIAALPIETGKRIGNASNEMIEKRNQETEEFKEALSNSNNSNVDATKEAIDSYNATSDNPYLSYRNSPDVPDFSGKPDDPLTSWLYSKTGAGLTENEKLKMMYQTWERQSAEAYNHNEAVDARMYEQYMAQNKYQFETQSMVDAGINPAMVYGGGSLVPTSATGAAGSVSPQSAPSSPSTGSLVGLIDVLGSVLRLPLEMKKLNAEINSIDAGTNKTKTETKVLDAKLPFEIDNLKAQVRNSNLNSDAQEIINSYLDRQQAAELRMKNANIDQVEESIKKMVKEIEKMDYEELTMVISWMETNEKILNLQKQRDLTDTQMKELESLIRVNNATASKINLDVSNYDDIQVVGTASTSFRLGPFSVAEGQPITLAMLKAAREAQKEEKEKEEKPKSMKEIKEEYPE